MKKLICLLVITCFASKLFAQLRISDDKRHLVTEDGKPFFWLGDTAWELFHRQEMKFAPPTKVAGEDWVLVLDDAARKYPAPGTQP